MSLCEDCFPECEHDYCDSCAKCHDCGKYASAPAAPVYPAGRVTDRNPVPSSPAPIRVPSGFSDQAYYAYTSHGRGAQVANLH